jgi:succinate dehydrogenase / fumarate reductase cytochrome b subunit
VQAKGLKKASLASRTMAPQGALILAFVVSHLATFKFGTVYQTTVDGVAMRDLFRLMIEVFQQPGYVAWYIVCLLLLGFHLSHGVGSLFQSLGLKNDMTAPSIQRISKIYAWVVAAGFLAQPLYVFFIHGQGQ